MNKYEDRDTPMIRQPQPDKPDAYHGFEAFDGASGYACTRLVMKAGEADDCGLPADMHPAFWLGPRFVMVFTEDRGVVMYTRDRT